MPYLRQLEHRNVDPPFYGMLDITDNKAGPLNILNSTAKVVPKKAPLLPVSGFTFSISIAPYAKFVGSCRN